MGMQASSMTALVSHVEELVEQAEMSCSLMQVCLTVQAAFTGIYVLLQLQALRGACCRRSGTTRNSASCSTLSPLPG